MIETVRIYCEASGAFHERHGRTEIATMRRRTATEPDGTIGWFEVEHRRGKRKRSGFDLDAWIDGREYRPVGEVLLDPDGGVMTPGARRSASLESERHVRLSYETADGDVVNLPPTHDVDAARTRNRFSCPCGLTVPIRGETLWPILDRLDLADIPEISLRALRQLAA